MNNKKNKLLKSALFLSACFGLMMTAGTAIAAVSGATIGEIASNVTSSFAQLGNAITAASYIAGLGFAIGAIMKFKQHKDNPTQIPIGTPIALIFIAAALLFLPSILGTAGSTMFGTSGGSTAGPTGVTIT